MATEISHQQMETQKMNQTKGPKQIYKSIKFQKLFFVFLFAVKKILLIKSKFLTIKDFSNIH